MNEWMNGWKDDEFGLDYNLTFSLFSPLVFSVNNAIMHFPPGASASAPGLDLHTRLLKWPPLVMFRIDGQAHPSACVFSGCAAGNTGGGKWEGGGGAQGCELQSV